MSSAPSRTPIRPLRVRLLAIDLDGTLLDDDRRLTSDGADAIRRARAEGITVVLASGRILASLQPFARAIGLSGPFICSNGAHVVSEGGEELLFHELRREVREIVIDFAERRSLHLNAYTREELLYLAETPWMEVYRNRARAVVPRLTNRQELLSAPLAKMMLVGDPESIANLRSEISRQIEPGQATITESEPEYLEFLSPKANKGFSLAALASSLGISRGETAAIGDYLNDVEMLQWAGFSASVANAAPEAKNAADVVVESNEGGGVAQFIDSYVINRQE